MKALPALLLLAGCAGTGTGWSRASDLSVYSSAHAFARMAWEQQVMCRGADPAQASAGFEREFGARDAAVRAALIRKHGEAALARSGTAFVPLRECGDRIGGRYRGRYVQLLRVLEIRLGLI